MDPRKVAKAGTLPAPAAGSCERYSPADQNQDNSAAAREQNQVASDLPLGAVYALTHGGRVVISPLRAILLSEADLVHGSDGHNQSQNHRSHEYQRANSHDSGFGVEP